jgi:hypothetical protein
LQASSRIFYRCGEFCVIQHSLSLNSINRIFMSFSVRKTARSFCKRPMPVAAAAILAISAPMQAAHAVILYDISATAGGNTFTVPGNWGFQFTVTSPLTVGALGLWDEGKNGLAASHSVGIFSAIETSVLPTLIASVTVSSASIVVPSANANGNWLFTNLASPLALPAGRYTLGYFNQAGATDAFRGSATTGIYMSGAAFFDGRARANATAFAIPDALSASGGGWYGPNLSTTVLAVPEPETWMFLAGGLAALSIALRRSRKDA